MFNGSYHFPALYDDSHKPKVKGPTCLQVHGRFEDFANLKLHVKASLSTGRHIKELSFCSVDIDAGHLCSWFADTDTIAIT